MLSVHIKEAERRKKDLEHQFTNGAKDVQKAAERVSDALLEAIDHDVSTAHLAERQIEAEIGKIERLLSSNASHTAQWVTTLDRLTGELKKMGDVTNWLEILEKVTLDIESIAHQLS